MQSIQYEKFKKSLEHFKLFFYIMNEFDKEVKSESKIDNEKYLRMMKSQYTNMKISLEDLGISFEDTGAVRRLNETIRELETKISEKVDIDFSNISTYVNNLENKLKEKIADEFGVYCSVQINVSDYVSVEIKYIKIESDTLSKLSRDFIKTDEELKEKENMAKKRNKIALSKFEVDEEGCILFTDKNKKTLEDMLTIMFSEYGDINGYDYSLTCYHKDKAEMKIQDIKFSMTVLPSHRNLKYIFAER